MQPGGARLLPRVAVVFIVVWLARSLVVEASILARPGHFGFDVAHSRPASRATATDTYTDLFLRLDRESPRAASVQITSSGTSPAIATSTAYWWATYYLYPRRASLRPVDDAPAADLLVIITAGGTAPAAAPSGYAYLDREVGPEAVVAAFRRAPG